MPPDQITTSIQDSFVTLAQRPAIKDVDGLSHHRKAVAAALREMTFAHFPNKPCPLDLRVEFEWALENAHGMSFSFAPENDVRLAGNLLMPNQPDDSRLTMVALQNTGDRYFGSSIFSDQAPAWRQVNIETRGTGRTSWGQDLQWHLRRAAMVTGRTIASMRVWDTLRALAATRELPGVDPGWIGLAGSGDMAAVVLYAALLDGKVSTVFLHHPPPTQDAPGNKDGSGETFEMLNCLQVTDLDQVAGLLFPTVLVFLGSRPPAYEWAVELYEHLGGRVCQVSDLNEWKPDDWKYPGIHGRR